MHTTNLEVKTGHRDPETHQAVMPRPRGWWMFFICVSLFLGVGLRFVHLGQKPYGNDEAFTLLRLSGTSDQELYDRFFDGHQFRIDELRPYQRLRPENGIIATVQSLRSEPQHVPIYFIMARLWSQRFGTEATAMRSLPVLLSLFALPCLYWLCRELFDLAFTAWLAVALFAVSPLHMAYAQEARPYSLFVVTVLLSSALLLRAIRIQSKWSWGLYAAALACSLYTYLLAGLLMVGHGIYVFLLEHGRWNKVTQAYVLSSLAGLLTLIPWLLLISTHSAAAKTTLAWQATGLPFTSLVKAWGFDLSRLFFDSGHVSYTIGYLDWFYLIPATFGVGLLSGYSLYFLYHHTPRRVWLFIYTLVGTTALTLTLTDVLLQRQMSVNSRYFFAAYVGIQLAVSYVLAVHITAHSTQVWRPHLWRMGACALAFCGVLSCAIFIRADVWWTKLMSGCHNPEVANLINQDPDPLLLSDNLGHVLSLSHLLKPTVRVQLFQRMTPRIATAHGDIYLYGPSPTLLNDLETTNQIELISREGKLWRLIPIYPPIR